MLRRRESYSLQAAKAEQCGYTNKLHLCIKYEEEEKNFTGIYIPSKNFQYPQPDFLNFVFQGLIRQDEVFTRESR
jgi:hypothetical protein